MEHQPGCTLKGEASFEYECLKEDNKQTQNPVPNNILNQEVEPTNTPQ